MRKSSCLKLRFSILIFVIFLLLAEKSFAQTDLSSLAELLTRGNSEQKRDALFQIRNLKTTEAARLAVPVLRDKNEIVRASAAKSVVFLPAAEAVRFLLPLLNDKKTFVRKETAYALGETRNADAVRALGEAIRKDKNQEVKDASVVALGAIGDVSAIAALTEILQRQPKQSEEFMRRAAARAVGEIAANYSPQQFVRRKNSDNSLPNFAAELRADLSEKISDFQNPVKILIQILQKRAETDDVKREAAYALGAIGDVSAIPVLQSKLDAEDYYLAEICRESLRKLQTVSK